jgi:hypothetical protein
MSTICLFAKNNNLANILQSKIFDEYSTKECFLYTRDFSGKTLVIENLTKAKHKKLLTLVKKTEGLEVLDGFNADMLLNHTVFSLENTLNRNQKVLEYEVSEVLQNALNPKKKKAKDRILESFQPTVFISKKTKRAKNILISIALQNARADTYLYNKLLMHLGKHYLITPL